MTIGGKDSYNSAMRELGSIHETVKNIKDIRLSITDSATRDVNLKLNRLFQANETISQDIQKLENYYSSGFTGAITKLWHSVTGSPIKQAREDQKVINDEISQLSHEQLKPTVNRQFERALMVTINPEDLEDFQSFIPRNLTKEQYESGTEKLSQLWDVGYRSISLSSDDVVVKDFVKDLFDPNVPVQDMERMINDRLMVKDAFKAQKEELTSKAKERTRSLEDELFEDADRALDGTRTKGQPLSSAVEGEEFIASGDFEKASSVIRKDQREQFMDLITDNLKGETLKGGTGSFSAMSESYLDGAASKLEHLKDKYGMIILSDNDENNQGFVEELLDPWVSPEELERWFKIDEMSGWAMLRNKTPESPSKPRTPTPPDLFT